MAKVSPISLIEVSSEESKSISSLRSCSQGKKDAEIESISVDDQGEEIIIIPKKLNKIDIARQQSNVNIEEFESDENSIRSVSRNATLNFPDNEETPEAFLDSERNYHKRIATTRREVFKSIILAEHLEFSWIEFLSRAFGILIVGILIPTPLTLIPLHDLVKFPEYWYEILCTGSYLMTLMGALLAIQFGSFMNIEYFLNPTSMKSMCFSQCAYTLSFLAITYLIWTHSYGYQYPIPFLAFPGLWLSKILGYIAIWFLFPRRVRQNKNLLKRMGWAILQSVLVNVYGTINTVIIGILRKSSDEYQPLLAIVLPVWREIYVWVFIKISHKATDGDQCGSIIYLKFQTNVLYAIQLCIVLGSIATDVTSWVLIGVDYSLNIWLCFKIVWENMKNPFLVEKQIEAIQDLVGCELVEFFLPISFLVSLTLTFWGPNGRLFGNIGNSYWGYTAIKNINQAIKNMMILGLVDFSSTLVSAFILWYFCRINLWKAFNELQREFFKTFSIVLGIYLLLVSGEHF